MRLRNVFLLSLSVLLFSQPTTNAISYPSPRMSHSYASADQIHAATFNIRVGRYASGGRRWDNRQAMVISLLAAEQYDVVGLQEALFFQLNEILIRWLV